MHCNQLTKQAALKNLLLVNLGEPWWALGNCYCVHLQCVCHPTAESGGPWCHFWCYVVATVNARVEVTVTLYGVSALKLSAHLQYRCTVPPPC